MSIRTITLCENTARFGFLAEWGLSIHVTCNGFQFLVDTGMTDVAVRNAAAFNIDLAALDAIVLSHGHRDHTGGLINVLEQSGPKPVIAHQDIFGCKFTLKHAPEVRDISMPHDVNKLRGTGAQFQFVSSYREIAPGIAVSGEIPMQTDYEHIDKGLYAGPSDELVSDPLRDDLSVAIQTDNGLFIIAGCAHRGIVNTIRHFQQMTGESKVYAVMGGFHLSAAAPDHIERVVAFFKKTGVTKVACSHCTGFLAACAFANAYGGNFIANHSGTRLSFNLDRPASQSERIL